MAERRMFSKSVINSARFLRMPQTSRLLYYDLGMFADDDGVVEAFTVIRTTGAAEDDLRVLASRGFIRVLNEDLVSHITDWRQNNYIQKDRYHPSIYAELLVKIADAEQVETECIHDVSELYTEARQDKTRQGETSIGEGNTRAGARDDARPPVFEEVLAFCRERKSPVSARRFFDYYDAAGWTDKEGKPIRNWKAALVSWERAEKGGPNPDNEPPRDPDANPYLD